MAVRVAGALTWFYDGTGGEYEYWPRGIDFAPPQDPFKDEVWRSLLTQPNLVGAFA